MFFGFDGANVSYRTGYSKRYKVSRLIIQVLVLNILPPAHVDRQIEVVYLNTLSKTQLVKRWEEALTYPERYIVAQAESMKELSGDIPAKELLTVGQYLDENKIQVDESDYHKLATRVADKHREVHGINPRKVSRNVNGKWNNKSYAYSEEDFGIIEECLLTVRHSRKN